MRKWVTAIKAIDPKDGTLKDWGGPQVPGLTRSMARRYLDTHGMGYCEILGPVADPDAKVGIGTNLISEQDFLSN